MVVVEVAVIVSQGDSGDESRMMLLVAVVMEVTVVMNVSVMVIMEVITHP